MRYIISEYDAIDIHSVNNLLTNLETFKKNTKT